MTNQRNKTIPAAPGYAWIVTEQTTLYGMSGSVVVAHCETQAQAEDMARGDYRGFNGPAPVASNALGAFTPDDPDEWEAARQLFNEQAAPGHANPYDKPASAPQVAADPLPDVSTFPAMLAALSGFLGGFADCPDNGPLARHLMAAIDAHDVAQPDARANIFAALVAAEKAAPSFEPDHVKHAARVLESRGSFAAAIGDAIGRADGNNRPRLVVAFSHLLAANMLG